MQCEACLGTGVILRRAFTGESPGRLVPRPCPECNGSGLEHCCEGLRPGNSPPAKVHPSLDESAGYDPAILRYFYEPRDARDSLPYDRPANGGDDER